jgi:hypothetical protein
MPIHAAPSHSCILAFLSVISSLLNISEGKNLGDLPYENFPSGGRNNGGTGSGTDNSRL